MNIGICFLTTDKKINNLIVNYIKTKLSECINNNINSNKKYELYTLLETEELNFTDYHKIPFNFNILKEKYNNRFFYIYKNFRGICHLPLFYFYDLHSEYDYYIFYEDDLLYTGFLFENNNNPFNTIPFENYDMMFMYDRIDNPNWHWRSKCEYNIPKKWIPYEGLLNCYIISNKALKELKDFCTNYSWDGHHELLVNSFFMNQQDKYKIGFVEKYIPCYINWLWVTTYQQLFFKELSQYCFIHPIKNNDNLKYVKSKCINIKEY